MNYNDAIKQAVGGNAVLFIGSGFSVGAVPLKGDKFLTGTQLANYLTETLVPSSDPVDLSRSAKRYLKKYGSDKLIKELQDLFTVKDIAESHKIIANVPWKRIYTTNYDNVIERASASNGKKIIPVTLDKDPRDYSQSNICLHINGYIDELTSNTLESSFKLTNTSYLTSHFRDSIWVEVFRRSLQTAASVIFIGYSLYDIDIQEILFATPLLKKKTIFIEKDNINKDLLVDSDINDFGEIYSVGIDQFSKDILNEETHFIKDEMPVILSGFDEFLPNSTSIKELRINDVFDLLLKGDVNVNDHLPIANFD